MAGFGLGPLFVQNKFCAGTPFRHATSVNCSAILVNLNARSTAGANRFAINLKAGGDVLFHFNPRFKEHAIVRNSLQSGAWGAEERVGGIPIEHSKDFSVVIAGDSLGYNVYINGQHFTHYKHRFPVHSQIDLVEIEGDLQIIESLVIGGANGRTAERPPVPFIQQLAGFGKESFVVVNAKPDRSQRFAINLKSGQDDIVFHFNPRPKENAIVRNSRRAGTWGNEERGMGFPAALKSGKPFSILIAYYEKQFFMYINGEKFPLSFFARLAVEQINCLEIEGDVQLNSVHVSNAFQGQPGGFPASNVPSYPTQMPSAPPAYAQPAYGAPTWTQPQPPFCPTAGHTSGVYPHIPAPTGPPKPEVLRYGQKLLWKLRNHSGYKPVYFKQVPFHQPIYGGMFPGRKVTLSGVAPFGADKFTINFQAGPTDVAFHFDVRFGNRSVVRNTLQAGNWQYEETEGQFPFTHNQPFNIVIQAAPEAYFVYVNGGLFFSFRHRLSPQTINQLEVTGNIQLTSVDVQ